MLTGVTGAQEWRLALGDNLSISDYLLLYQNLDQMRSCGKLHHYPCYIYVPMVSSPYLSTHVSTLY